MEAFGADTGRAALEIARSAIASLLGLSQSFAGDGCAELDRPGGAFVTLKTRDGKLRGCIGSIESPLPLRETIERMAVSAASRDPRFPPLEASEFERVHLEVSLLSPLSPIQPEDVVVGKHGLLIAFGGLSGLLLPQVPVEWGWDRETYLDQLCHKAGLPAGTWKDQRCVLNAFSAQVFEEE